MVTLDEEFRADMITSVWYLNLATMSIFFSLSRKTLILDLRRIEIRHQGRRPPG